MFNLNNEGNVPTLFEAALMMGCAILLSIIAFDATRRLDRDAWAWCLLAFGFALMFVDELWSFHERLVQPTKQMLHMASFGYFYFAWVVPALALLVTLLVVFAGFLTRLPNTFRMRFLFSGAIFAGGAVGMEMIGGRFAEQYGHSNFTYAFIASLEESMEMAGLILFIHSLLDYLGLHLRCIEFKFQ